jgi:DNA-binding transcriptional regulator YdaS (Cro superfamily)
MNALNLAIQKAGGMQPLAALLGIRYQAIQSWRALGRPPAERCLAIERLTGVSRHELRPDIYGPAPVSRKRAA